MGSYGTLCFFKVLVQLDLEELGTKDEHEVKLSRNEEDNCYDLLVDGQIIMRFGPESTTYFDQVQPCSGFNGFTRSQLLEQVIPPESH